VFAGFAILSNTSLISFSLSMAWFMATLTSRMLKGGLSLFIAIYPTLKLGLKCRYRLGSYLISAISSGLK